MVRARRVGLTVYPPSWTLELLAFDEYCRFDTSAFFLNIKRASLYIEKESRSIKTAAPRYSSKANSSNIRDFPTTKTTVLNLVEPRVTPPVGTIYRRCGERNGSGETARTKDLYGLDDGAGVCGCVHQAHDPSSSRYRSFSSRFSAVLRPNGGPILSHIVQSQPFSSRNAPWTVEETAATV